MMTDAEEAEMLRDLESAANAKIGHLERELASLRPKWTKTPPTKPGWYWARIGGETYATQVLPDNGAYTLGGAANLLGWYVFGEVPQLVDRFDLWAGPIEAPPLPEEV